MASTLRTVDSLRRHFPTTALTRLLNIRYPIIQAPMSPICPPPLVAATSNAGGLGSIPAARMSPDQLRSEVAAVRRLTRQPFAVNLFVPKDGGHYTDEQVAHVRDILATRVQPHITQPSSLPAAPPPAAVVSADERMSVSLASFERQVEALLSVSAADGSQPTVFSFTFGIPSLDILAQCKQHNITTLGTATTPADAAALLATGLVDGIICQGAEAGGHRGTFTASDADTMQPGSAIGIFALLPLVRAMHPTIPLIAAGAVMTGSQLAAALLLGADGAQCGTRFLTATEATLTPAAHRSVLLAGREQLTQRGLYRDTVLTRVFSGRAARGFRNEMVNAFDERDAPDSAVLPWEVQASQVQPYVREAAKSGDTRWMQMWSGQGYPMCNEKSAADIVQEIMDEATAVLGHNT